VLLMERQKVIDSGGFLHLAYFLWGFDSFYRRPAGFRSSYFCHIARMMKCITKRGGRIRSRLSFVYGTSIQLLDW
jgi:hypothetical protein